MAAVLKVDHNKMALSLTTCITRNTQRINLADQRKRLRDRLCTCMNFINKKDGQGARNKGNLFIVNIIDKIIVYKMIEGTN